LSEKGLLHPQAPQKEFDKEQEDDEAVAIAIIAIGRGLVLKRARHRSPLAAGRL